MVFREHKQEVLVLQVCLKSLGTFLSLSLSLFLATAFSTFLVSSGILYCLEYSIVFTSP